MNLIYRADSAAAAITTTDLVSKSVAVESQVGSRHLCTLFLAFNVSYKNLKLLRSVEPQLELGVWQKAPG